MNLHSARGTKIGQHVQVFQNLDSARGEESAAHLLPWKEITLERNRVNATAGELARARRTGKAAADDRYIHTPHFLATSTSRYGKLRHTCAGIPTLLAIS